MKINEQILIEIKEAIQKRESESFDFATTGGLKHFITSEEKECSGHYIGSQELEGKSFKIYMI